LAALLVGSASTIDPYSLTSLKTPWVLLKRPMVVDSFISSQDMASQTWQNS